MVKPSLAVFTRDRQTGSMKELTSGETIRHPFLHDRASAQELRVLVADENERDRRLTIQHLGEAWPFARDLVAESATDGAEALKKIRRHPYAFVVLDCKLPPADGADLLRAIRAEGRRVPVIVVSAQPRTDIASDLQALAAAFVNKNELTPDRFQNAMVTAILMTQRVFGLVKAEPIRVRNGFPVPTTEARFVRRSSQLVVRPTALLELR